MEKEMATHSSIVAWRILWTVEPGGLLSMGSAQSRTRLKQLSMQTRIGERNGNPLLLLLLSLDPLDSSPSGSSVPGILQARTLEWVAISFSNACK